MEFLGWCKKLFLLDVYFVCFVYLFCSFYFDLFINLLLIIIIVFFFLGGAQSTNIVKDGAEN